MQDTPPLTQQELDKIKNRISQIEKQLQEGTEPKKDKKDNGLPFYTEAPEIGTPCWYFNSYNETTETCWMNNEEDKSRLVYGQCFKTEEAAQNEYEKRGVLFELEKFIAENEEEKVDWGNPYQNKYYLEYDHQIGDLDVNTVGGRYRSFTFYSTSKETMEKAIDLFGDRLKKYVFKVK